MRRPHVPCKALALLSLGFGFLPHPEAKAWELQTQYQEGNSSRPKQLWFPHTPKLKQADAQSIARLYLQREAQSFGLSSDLHDIRLMETRQSLLGQHLYFQQMQGDIPVDGAGITLSLLSDGSIYQVYNTLEPSLSFAAPMRAKLSLEAAYDKAWQALGVREGLFEAPKGRLLISKDSSGARLIYRIELSTLAPYGAWLADIDAQTGTVVKLYDQRISHKPKQKPKEAMLEEGGALLDRQEAFRAWYQSQSLKQVQATEAKDGKALVFDPDPRTSLLNRNLEDDSDAADFKDAYFERVLPALAFDGKQYALSGPWVKIIDFDPPRTAPSTSKDGNWNFARGANAFNDAMTYFHIDQSQRYLQSLGFKGDTGIQYGPIEADSDGVNGDDNSYFQPSSNRLAFGHGCVDDNEDADVILHEYGHALHFSINSRWNGGDTGAMGEGFGDYWAASYSLSTPHGKSFAPNDIYSWDGHGNTNACWPGRVLNALEARYDPSRSYPAHSTIPGGFQSDELWSTPLFQSLLTLVGQGIPREEVDRIVLQAQFGLGAQLKMRDMAQSILATARLLYPKGPHFQVFKGNFVRHGIIEEPHPKLALVLDSLLESSGDAIVDPGEDVELKLKLSNGGTLAADEIRLSLSSSDTQVTLENASSTYPRLDIGESGLNANTLSFKVSKDASCGSLLNFEALVQYQNGTPVRFPFQIRVGKAIGVSKSVQKLTAIPDNDQKGIEIPLELKEAGAVSDQLHIAVQIKHPFRGDLKVSLEAPSGKSVLLHDRTGFGDDDLRGVYPITLQPKEPLTRLVGEERAGIWKLHVADVASTDAGSFESWGLEDISSYACTSDF